MNRGLYLAFVTAIISGISIFINKFAVASFDNPVLLPAIKNGLVGLLFISVLMTLGKWEKIKSLNKKQVGQLILIGIIGGALPFYLFFTGLSQTPAVNASIIHKSLVLWVALFAIPLLKEKVNKTQALAVLLLFAGNLMIGGFKGLTYSKGEIMILIATLLWAVETVLVKKVLKSVDPNVIASARMVIGSLLLTIIATLSSPTDITKIAGINPWQWFWIGLTSLTLFGYVSCWYRALKLESAISVSAILVSATLVTNILSAIFITHTWNLTLTYQGSIIAGGVALMAMTHYGQKSPATRL